MKINIKKEKDGFKIGLPKRTEDELIDILSTCEFPNICEVSNICDDCKRNVFDRNCGAKVSQYVVVKGIGVIKCELFCK